MNSKSTERQPGERKEVCASKFSSGQGNVSRVGMKEAEGKKDSRSVGLEEESCCSSESDERDRFHNHDKDQHDHHHNNDDHGHNEHDSCDGHDHDHDHDDGSAMSEVSECCSNAGECICNEGCQANYASLLHQQSGCKRAPVSIISRQTSSTALLSSSSTEPPKPRTPPKLSCTHCLRNAKEMSYSIAGNAKACYCKLTRSLCKSVKSLATVEFSSGCCKVDEIREKREHGHDHDECDDEGGDGHDHGHGSKDLPKVASGEVVSVENAAGARFRRRVALGVAGMHCTSCAEEVAGILRQIPGVEIRSVQVSFVLSRAELAYDPEVITDVDVAIVAKVLKRFPRLDVVVLINTDVGDEMSGIMRVRISAIEGSAQGLMDALVEIPGVVLVTPCTAKEVEVEVAYDPDRVGIRTILRKLRDPAGFGEVRLDDVPDGGKLAQEAEARHLKRTGIQTVLAAILTIPVLVLAWSGGKLNVPEKTRLAVECSCASMVIIVAYNIYLDALWAAWYGKGFLAKINMDTLVSVATIAAYAFSVGVLAVNLSGKGFGNGKDQEPFFETSTLLTTLILLGRWVTAHVKSQASRKLRSVGDGDLQTTEVRLYDPEQKSEIDLDARELEYGDILVVSQGERVATDGLVIEGSGQLDESHLTGEPKPQHKNEGSFLLAGSTVVSGNIKYRVSKLLQENTISSIKGMVKLASQQKPRKQVLADRVAAVLTPIVFLIACLVFLIWILVEGLVRKAGWGPGAVSAATYAVATLAISCPCALALAVPLVMVVSSRVGVERGGFVCKNPAAMEKGPKVRKVVFDKTGTLTTGHLHVDQAQVLKDGQWSSEVPLSVFHIISVLCRTSSHPVARAMFQLASESYLQVRVDSGQSNIEVEDVVSKGIQANINGSVYRGGKLAFTAPDYIDDPIVKKNLQAAQSVFTLSCDHELVAMFSLKDDKIRSEVPAVLKALRDRNIEIYIFSGDRSEAVTPIARELGIPAANVFADCYPEDKRARLEILKKPLKKLSDVPSSEEGESRQPQSSGACARLLQFFSRNPSDQPGAVVFVGDGTNDAIALAAADIGVSLSQATEMASNSADVAIISDSIAGLVGFLALSKRIDKCIKLNFSWAVFWNLFAILGASGAWVSVRIPPEWAGLGELGSVLPVFVISALVGVGFRGFEG